MTCGIYRIVNTITRRCYYGSSEHIELRWKTHVLQLNNNKHHNIYLQRSWTKHGMERFIFEIVEEINDSSMLFAREQYYIDNNYNGYNLAPAGGGDILTTHPFREEIIKKMSESIRQRMDSMTEEEKKQKYGKSGDSNPNWRGGTCSKICPKCRKNEMDYYSSSCTYCRDISAENNPFYGKRHTDESRLKISNALRGRKRSDDQILKMSGENSSKFMGYYHTPWGVFPSSSHAEREHEYLLSNTINNWCKNPDKIIMKFGVSRFLRELGEDIIGKTYRDIGFWFTPKDDQQKPT